MVIRYTTAPTSYDGFGTKDLGVVGFLLGKPLRKVEIEALHLARQEDRYWSGFYRLFEECLPLLTQVPIF